MADAGISGQNRPKAATAVGIMNIIFGGSGIISGIVSLSMYSIIRSLVTAAGREFAHEFDPFLTTISTFFTIVLVIGLVQFIIRITGLVSGIGLLKKKYWSINLANIYAGATIILLIANFFAVRQIIHGVFENPMLLESIPSDGLFVLNIVKTIIPLFAGIFGIIFGSAYPIIVLVLLNRSKVKDFYVSMRDEGDDGIE